MSIGTVPQRWKALDTGPDQVLSSKERLDRQAERAKRIEKTTVSVLNYHTTEMKREKFTSAHALRDSLCNGAEDSSLNFKLYVVEDLSRDVIEILGQKCRSLAGSNPPVFSYYQPIRPPFKSVSQSLLRRLLTVFCYS